MKYNRSYKLVDILLWPISFFFSGRGRKPRNPLMADELILNPDLTIEREFCFVGDMMGIGSKLPNLSQELIEFIGNCEAFIGNLECLISDSKKLNLKTQNTSLASIKHFIEQLPNVKLAVSLANNHSFDNKKRGLEQTISSLGEMKIKCFGTLKEPSFGKVVGATQWGNSESFKEINSLDKLSLCEDEIGFFHWGEEFTHTLSKEVEHFLDKTKSKLIIGHHPHIPHMPFKLKNKIIFSSLGNFWISYGGSRVNRGLILKVSFSKNKIVSLKWRSIQCSNRGDSLFIDILKS